MDRITAKEAAEKWNVSIRTVQHLCVTGRISGAEQWGRTWMIPADAQRPADKRLKVEKAEEEREATLSMPKQSPLPLMTNLYQAPGTAHDCIAAFSDQPELQALMTAWLSYMQGDAATGLSLAHSLLSVNADFYSSISLGTLFAACSLWDGDPALWSKGKELLQGVPCHSEEEIGIRDYWLAVANASLADYSAFLDRFYAGYFERFPVDSLPAANFYYAKHLHHSAKNHARGEKDFADVNGIGLLRVYPYVVEPLVRQVQREGSLLAELCIRLLLVDVYRGTDQMDVALHHLDAALALAAPDRLYGILAEFRPLLGTLLDEHLRPLDPDGVEVVKHLQKELLAGLSSINRKLLNKTMVVLSDRETEIARLAAIGLSNAEIAQRLFISVNTVKSIVASIMNKTGTQNRREFSLYVP